jgi:hypothetical protein
MRIGVSVVSAALVAGIGVGAQAPSDPVISRGAPQTLTGEIVEMSCYRQKGVAGSTGAAHAACAKECVLNKGTALGILSDGDGLFRIWGPYAQNKYAKALPFVGQYVTITGAEVVLSNNYDARSFDLQTMKAAKRPGGPR